MTLITTFSTPQEAAIAAGMLENNGISCQVQQQSALSSIFPTPDGSNFGGTSLYVADSQAEEALRLLKEHGDL